MTKHPVTPPVVGVSRRGRLDDDDSNMQNKDKIKLIAMTMQGMTVDGEPLPMSVVLVEVVQHVHAAPKGKDNVVLIVYDTATDEAVESHKSGVPNAVDVVLQQTVAVRSLVVDHQTPVVVTILMGSPSEAIESVAHAFDMKVFVLKLPKVLGNMAMAIHLEDTQAGSIGRVIAQHTQRGAGKTSEVAETFVENTLISGVAVITKRLKFGNGVGHTASHMVGTPEDSLGNKRGVTILGHDNDKGHAGTGRDDVNALPLTEDLHPAVQLEDVDHNMLMMIADPAPLPDAHDVEVKNVAQATPNELEGTPHTNVDHMSGEDSCIAKAMSLKALIVTPDAQAVVGVPHDTRGNELVVPMAVVDKSCHLNPQAMTQMGIHKASHIGYGVLAVNFNSGMLPMSDSAKSDDMQHASHNKRPGSHQVLTSAGIADHVNNWSAPDGKHHIGLVTKDGVPSGTPHHHDEVKIQSSVPRSDGELGMDLTHALPDENGHTIVTIHPDHMTYDVKIGRGAVAPDVAMDGMTEHAFQQVDVFVTKPGVAKVDRSFVVVTANSKKQTMVACNDNIDKIPLSWWEGPAASRARFTKTPAKTSTVPAPVPTVPLPL